MNREPTEMAFVERINALVCIKCKNIYSVREQRPSISLHTGD